jgi:hypothetical protein
MSTREERRDAAILELNEFTRRGRDGMTEAEYETRRNELIQVLYGILMDMDGPVRPIPPPPLRRARVVARSYSPPTPFRPVRRVRVMARSFPRRPTLHSVVPARAPVPGGVSVRNPKWMEIVDLFGGKLRKSVGRSLKARLHPSVWGKICRIFRSEREHRRRLLGH